MLGHLVVGRFASGSDEKIYAAHESGWMTRMFRALFRKKP